MLLLLLLPGLLLAQQSGLAIVGGRLASTSAEFWAPAPGEVHCSLPNLPRGRHGHTLDSWEDSLTVCSGWLAGWQHWRKTLHTRQFHTSAVTSQGLLLLGGSYSPNTTELLPWEGGESREGFSLQHDGHHHCSIQTSPGTIVLTGGPWSPGPASSLVTEYSGLGSIEEVTSRELPPFLHPRALHACGWYSVGDSQVSPCPRSLHQSPGPPRNRWLPYQRLP